MRSSGSTPPPTSLQSFLGELLADQQRLDTPVARFAAAHDRQGSQLSALRSQLIPLTAPTAGEQYAFEVDLDSCSGCKACVAGCHSLNGLDDNETWRDVGLVLGGDAQNPFQQTITSACHHCADPACANGCPVLAYEKDPVTGIVRHLDDQCIGCSYCVLKCPYDVPKFNTRLGIVRKCDMCHGRLAAGEAPACVQACPTHAIKIVTVSVAPDLASGPSEVGRTARTQGPALQRKSFDTSTFLPVAVAFESSYTRPTTRFVSKHPLPQNVRAADSSALRPQPAHWPLVVMLVLTQLSVGLLAAGVLREEMFVTYYVTNISSSWLRWGAVVNGALGLAASVLHLGQPMRAWRVFLNLRKSWLSREAVIFGGYFAALAGAMLPTPFARALSITALVAGLAGVFCSAMIYADTRRNFWRPSAAFMRMGGTVLVGILAAMGPIAATLALAAKLACEALALRGTGASAQMQRGPLRAAVGVRFALGVAACVLFSTGFVFAGFATWLGGEFAERYLFFRAVDAPKMPGVPAA